VTLSSGAQGRAIAPAGASTGSGEALERRDKGKRLQGQDVQAAIGSIRGEIARALIGLPISDQARIDQILIDLDGTPQKSRLGGNATIAVSLAALNAAAISAGRPLWRYLAGELTPRIPLPQIQIFGGGMHADRRIALQDVMVVCPAAASFAEALEWTAEIYYAAGRLMRESGRLRGLADEGGYWPDFSSNECMLEAAVDAINSAGLKPGAQVGLSLDVAASSFGKAGQYRPSASGPVMTRGAWLKTVEGWLRDFPIFAIEDPVAEDDPEEFAELTAAYGSKVHIVGDDVLVTSAPRIQQAAEGRWVTAALIKPNQVGTISECERAFDLARQSGLATIVSARSGESEDTSIAHLAVGWSAEILKVGSIARGERNAKWNEVLRIEETLGAKARFAGWEALRCRS
jgi:enolase